MPLLRMTWPISCGPKEWLLRKKNCCHQDWIVIYASVMSASFARFLPIRRRATVFPVQISLRPVSITKVTVYWKRASGSRDLGTHIFSDHDVYHLTKHENVKRRSSLFCNFSKFNRWNISTQDPNIWNSSVVLHMLLKFLSNVFWLA